MRLTIRTLLGYMDDILDRQDAEEIGRRIEESEVATTLFHRIRDVTRRLSLKAPDLDDDGDGLDPNTVAEYLDNVLPDDRVPDFEKVCLDSDMHLAEVAACHQILAVALGEAAEIDVASREHMYQLPQVAADLDKLDRPPRDPLGLTEDEEDEAFAHIPKRPTPVVPDYLRERPRRLPTVPIVMGGFVVACVVIVVLALSGVFASWGINPGQETGTEVAKNDQEGLQGKADGQASTEGQQTGEENLAPASVSDTASDTAAEGVSPANQNDELPVIPGVTVDASSEGQAAGGIATPGAVAPTEGDLAPSEDTTAPSIPGVMGNITPSSSTPGGSDLAPNPVPANPTNPASPIDPAVGDISEDDTSEEPVKPEQPALIGRFVSENQALVQLDPADGSWKVVPQQSVLTNPTPLVALPTFRPIIATASGLSVQLLSETQVTMQPTQTDDMPVLKLHNGRIVLRSLGKSNLRLLLTAGNKTGIVTLVNPDSAAAVELTFHRKPGFDPIEVPSTVELKLYVIAGTVLWEEGEKSEPLKVDASECVTFAEGESAPKVTVLAELPSWIAVPSISKLDQNASEAIYNAFAGNQIASLALREQLDHRQREVSRLALKSLTQLGELEAAVASLDDTNEKLIWDQTIAQLFELSSQSPTMAQNVKQAFEREYGDAAPNLWRMLWGYTKEQLENDGAIQLVEYLENDRLVFRVMSFYNLKQITGKSLYYKPEETPVRRNTPIQRWKSELEKGKIVPTGE